MKPPKPTPTKKQKTLAQLIKECKFDWTNPDITEEHFPKQPVRGKVELMHFGKYISSQDAIKKMTERGLKPANIYELLEFGKENPDEQRKYPIVGLGSAWHHPLGYRFVPYLDWGGSGRGLGLQWFGGGWGRNYRFACVRTGTLTLGESELPEEITINNVRYRKV